MKRATIQRKFKDTNKDCDIALISKAISIIYEYNAKHYPGHMVDRDYCFSNYSWACKQDILNRQSDETMYKVTVDYIENLLFDIDSYME